MQHLAQANLRRPQGTLWLGHASDPDTEIYLRADPTEKLEMIAGMTMPKLKSGRFRPPDKLLAMLAGKTVP